jgi:hypothetical protein
MVKTARCSCLTGEFTIQSTETRMLSSRDVMKNSTKIGSSTCESLSQDSCCVRVCLCMYGFVCVRMYVCVCIYIYIYFIYIYIKEYLCMCMCTYIYIYIY